jgi:predicted nucleotidyltransferase component of viral defense system
VIRKQDILDRAVEWGLRPDVVEKDYVLGWLLAGFAAHRSASSSWVFKGGTCLKKCLFETYRFSEDLDFSLLPSASYDEASLRALVVEVASSAAEMSGATFPEERVTIRVRRDKLGRATFEGKVAYQGPLRMPTWPRVLLDITQHEPLVHAPASRPVFHPYPDQLPKTLRPLCYSREELFAEKARALLERTRPRDLYDVVHLWDRRDDADLSIVRDVLRKKCIAKNVPPPSTATLTSLVRASGELRADWSNMLAHQLPMLPALDGLLDRLDEVLAWIDAPQATHTPIETIRFNSGETLVAPQGGTYWGGGQKLELVRFAGANRLKISFLYDGKLRIAEPYSLRRKKTGNLLLYAWEEGATHIKAFTTTNMRDVQTTAESFIPRFRVELTG